ncbi:lysylphosphatidylglycerol synthase transmembrane domain-containing protein [Herbivorax sp. ANBcel31]|uniref:lysylphosphatidylglycerol synthase transmembrane domain-containing protein n=1 Tax=Herbivorax sp. ANBcel31 TaxID=3069754 RepID=UPI0027B37BAC|nr:lysylphosphatidylglycerol synthase transmembrane domain-containing protein [Herbivorax sp. ANBcel31]MDQ2087732.1 lysylphosphatidylglycerol synthase transmembrane domain-containing protein [Herbivorax sp. ANBcel31]
MKKTFLLIVGIALCLVVVLVLGWEDVYTVISRISISQLLYLTILQLATLFSTTYILHYLLKQKSPTVSLGSVFGINLAGSFVESVTPSVKVGGEALKVYLMQKETGLEYSQLTAITLLSKFFSMLPFLVISFITLCVAFFSFEIPVFVYLAFIGLSLFFVLFLLLFNLQGLNLHVVASRIFNKKKTYPPLITKIFHKINKIYDFMIQTSIQSKTVIRAKHKRIFLFAIALMVWALYPLKVYLVTRILGYELNVIVVIIATFTAYLVSMIPLLPGGLATFEGSMALILAYEGLSSHEAFSIALMTRVITFWIPLLISGIVMIYYLNKAKKLKKLSSKKVESR